jgi:DNA-binding response OmpR family regulator
VRGAEIRRVLKEMRAAILLSNCPTPLAQGHSMAASRPPGTRLHLAKATTRILIIDDDILVSTAIQAILGRRRYETVLASRAHAGIHAFQTSGFNLVMVDLFMPGMNGLETITRIRSESAVPIIAMSGFRLRNSRDPDRDFLVMAMQRGATNCLSKPFSPPQLVAAIERSLGLSSITEESMR